MKTIGLIGGLTWHSTIDYYRHFNQMVQAAKGGDHSAKVVVHSLDFAEIRAWTEAGDWDRIADTIIDLSRKTIMAGADCILLGANTMHHIADRVQEAISVPLIHIADAAAQAIRAKGVQTVALLGTRYTMLFDFYKNRLATHGIQTLIPAEKDIQVINHAIYEEMGKGRFLPPTKKAFLKIIDGLVGQGAEGAILGCTEIPLLIKQEDTSVPVFDTAVLHARAAVDFALAD